MLAPTDSKEDYIANLKVYHNQLVTFVERMFGITVDYIEPIAWGYHTTAFYLKAQPVDYLVRLSADSPEKKPQVLKEIYLSQLLHNLLPTTLYLKSNAGSYIEIFDTKLVRVSRFTQGVSPFYITTAELKMCAKLLATVHSQAVLHTLNQDYAIYASLAHAGPAIPALKKAPAQQAVLLHGDLTPSNILVSYGKLSGILDFELSFIGPKEYDLARTGIYCWFRMAQSSLAQVIQVLLNTYQDTTRQIGIDPKLFLDLLQVTLTDYIATLKLHKTNYQNQMLFTRDLEFATKMLARFNTEHEAITKLLEL